MQTTIGGQGKNGRVLQTEHLPAEAVDDPGPILRDDVDYSGGKIQAEKQQRRPIGHLFEISMFSGF